MRFAIFFALLFVFMVPSATTITVGVPEFAPPFIMATTTNHFVGFDAEIMSEICRRIPVQCIFKPMEFGRIFDAVASGSTDIAIGSITITLARDEQFLFSLPYLPSYAQCLIKKNGTIRTVEDIPGKTFGIANTSIYAALIKKKYGDDVKIKYYELHTEMLSALMNGDVDALLLDKATAGYWVANSAGNYQQIGAPIQYGLGYGILANKTETDLVAQIDKAILAMQKDGTFLRIYSTYFSGNEFA